MEIPRKPHIATACVYMAFPVIWLLTQMIVQCWNKSKNDLLVIVITISQDRRSWKGAPETIKSNTPAKVGSLQQVTQAGIQASFEYL